MLFFENFLTKTQSYVAMNSNGRIFASEAFTKECKFKENVFENYWCIYSSIEHKDLQTSKLWILELNLNCVAL